MGFNASFEGSQLWPMLLFHQSQTCASKSWPESSGLPIADVSNFGLRKGQGWKMKLQHLKMQEFGTPIGASKNRFIRQQCFYRGNYIAGWWKWCLKIKKEPHFPNFHFWGSILVLRSVVACLTFYGWAKTHPPNNPSLSSLSFGVRPYHWLERRWKEQRRDSWTNCINEPFNNNLSSGKKKTCQAMMYSKISIDSRHQALHTKFSTTDLPVLPEGNFPFLQRWWTGAGLNLAEILKNCLSRPGN